MSSHALTQDTLPPLPEQERERAAFEAEMRCEEKWGHKSLKRNDKGTYLNSWTAVMWEVWQARAAIAAQAQQAQGVPAVNPYPSGSVREAWQRGFDGRPMIGHPASDYGKAYKEGMAAAAAPQAEPATAAELAGHFIENFGGEKGRWHQCKAAAHYTVPLFRLPAQALAAETEPVKAAPRAPDYPGEIIDPQDTERLAKMFEGKTVAGVLASIGVVPGTKAEPQPEREPLTQAEIVRAWGEAGGTRNGYGPYANAVMEICAAKWGIKLAGIGTKGGR